MMASRRKLDFSLSTSIEKMSADSDQEVQKVRYVEEVSETATSGMQNISAVTEEQLASVQEISAAASSLSKMASELETIIEKFKV